MADPSGTNATARRRDCGTRATSDSSALAPGVLVSVHVSTSCRLGQMRGRSNASTDSTRYPRRAAAGNRRDSLQPVLRTKRPSRQTSIGAPTDDSSAWSVARCAVSREAGATRALMRAGASMPDRTSVAATVETALHAVITTMPLASMRDRSASTFRA